MSLIANTPEPPYFAVIFSSTLSDTVDGYSEMAALMEEIASEQPGFLGIESAREQLGITVSYWDSEEAILNWKQNARHALAIDKGKSEWYDNFKVRVAKVERDYGFSREK